VRLLGVCAIATLGYLGIPAAEGAAPPRLPPLTQDFFSRPDRKPPAIHLGTGTAGVSAGYIFVAPKLRVTQAGPETTDDNGRPRSRRDRERPQTR